MNDPLGPLRPTLLPPMTRRPRRNSKRELLMQKAREHFCEHGFGSCHVADIAAAAGISKSTFFHYFADKGDLYRAAVVTLLDGVANGIEQAAAAEGSSRDKLSLLVQSLHHHLAVEPSIAPLLLRGLVDKPEPGMGSANVTAVERIVRRLRSAIDEGVASRTVSVVDAHHAAVSVLALMCLSRTPTLGTQRATGIGLDASAAAATSPDLELLLAQVARLVGFRDEENARAAGPSMLPSSSSRER